MDNYHPIPTGTIGNSNVGECLTYSRHCTPGQWLAYTEAGIVDPTTTAFDRFFFVDEASSG